MHRTGEGGAAAKSAIPNSCYSKHPDWDCPTARYPTDTPAPAHISTSAYSSQQHSTLLTTGPVSQGPSDPTKPTSDGSALPSKASTYSGRNGNADSDDSRDTMTDGLCTNFPANPTPDAPDDAHDPYGHEPAFPGQKSWWAFGARNVSHGNATADTLGPRRNTSPTTDAAREAKARHDVSAPG